MRVEYNNNKSCRNFDKKIIAFKAPVGVLIIAMASCYLNLLKRSNVPVAFSFSESFALFPPVMKYAS